MRQGSLFDSRGAARVSTDARGDRQRVLEYLAGRGHAGATDHEIAAGLGMLPDTARARRVELRDAGLVRDSGQRRPSPTGHAATVWTLASVPATGQHTQTGNVPPIATAQPARVGLCKRGPCPWCHRFAWWRSVHGVVVCGNCHPPARPELVAEWLKCPAGLSGREAAISQEMNRPGPWERWPFRLG